MQTLPVSPVGSASGMISSSQVLPGVPLATNTAQGMLTAIGFSAITNLMTIVHLPTPISPPVAPAGVPIPANVSAIPTPAATGADIIPAPNKQIRILVWHYCRKGWKVLLQSLKVIGGAVAIICGIWALSLAYWSATQQLKQSCINDKVWCFPYACLTNTDFLDA